MTGWPLAVPEHFAAHFHICINCDFFRNRWLSMSYQPNLAAYGKLMTQQRDVRLRSTPARSLRCGG